jgi:uracil-DNA glycosylase family 4
MDSMTTTAAAELERLAIQAEACRACPLGDVRTRAVFGVGSPTADLMFVGEAPGFHEDAKGEPFVGAAGQLLTKLIESKLGMKRSDVYIANVLKCRPPGNRDPRPDEVESCSPFLARQLELVNPRLIVALGNFAAHLLTGTQTGISRLRGKRFTYEGRTLLCTYHPAAALRGGAAAEGIAADFEQIKAVLDEAPAPAEDPATQLDLFG